MSSPRPTARRAPLGALLALFALSACDLPQQSVAPGPRAVAEVAPSVGTSVRARHRRPDHAITLRSGYSQSLTAAASDAFTGFYRYSTEDETWREMLGDSAFFRDAFVEGTTEHSGAVDGDRYFARATGPEGVQVTWATITFRASYNGEQDCFVTSGWYLCGGDYIYVEWYMTSQCMPPGEYTMEFLKNDQLIDRRTFTLKPSIEAGRVALHSQLNNTAQYSNYCAMANNTRERHPCDGREGELVLTIHRLGCAITSAAMMLSYHGVDVTPTALNSWLRANGGYSGASLYFNKIADYARQAGVDITYLGPVSGTDVAGLERAICQYGPQPTNVFGSNGSATGHWVLSWGRDNPRTTFRIYDPAGGVERTLQFARYRNTHSGRRVFAGPEKTYTDPYSGMTFKFHSPGDLLVTDPQGRRTGLDPLTGTTYREIPGAAYDSSAESDPSDPDFAAAVTREWELMRPAAGTYTLTVTGTGTGTYMLDMRTWSRTNAEGAATFDAVPISPGVRHTFQVAYDPDGAAGQIPMTGGFKGGGQSASVDALLTYSSPTERQIDLPAGTTSYPLFIFFGQGIDPSTFTAELNGVSVRSLFTPTAGGMNAVSLPLSRGRNVLLVNVRGGARLSRDADRLVFKVP